MKIILFVLCLFSFNVLAEECSSESKLFHKGSNELFHACHCKTLRPEVVVKLSEEYKVNFESGSGWKEEADGVTWYKCAFSFSFKDSNDKNAESCQGRFDEFRKKLKEEKSLSNFMLNFSPMMCKDHKF